MLLITCQRLWTYAMEIKHTHKCSSVGWKSTIMPDQRRGQALTRQPHQPNEQYPCKTGMDFYSGKWGTRLQMYFPPPMNVFVENTTPSFKQSRSGVMLITTSSQQQMFLRWWTQTLAALTFSPNSGKPFTSEYVAPQLNKNLGFWIRQQTEPTIRSIRRKCSVSYNL